MDRKKFLENLQIGDTVAIISHSNRFAKYIVVKKITKISKKRNKIWCDTSSFDKDGYNGYGEYNSSHIEEVTNIIQYEYLRQQRILRLLNKCKELTNYIDNISDNIVLNSDDISNIDTIVEYIDKVIK